MSSSSECAVLIPSSTLEDFPVDLDDCDARSLLAGWTVAWHPVLIAQSAQSPAWYRADAPPEPELSNESVEREPDTSLPFGGRMFIVPAVSINRLPAGYAERAMAAGARWVTGGSRQQYLAALDLEPSGSHSLEHDGRKISAEDFFAVGYVALQIQILTRRLRYTSNLDQIHVENCLVEAATAFVDGDAKTTKINLHQVFDALAEERDHYFSSDPHLIDLTLVTRSTLEAALRSPTGTSEEVPSNFLLDHSAVESLAQRQDDSHARNFKSRFVEGVSGWACGGPPDNWIMELAGDSEVERVMRQYRDQAASCIGTTPKVFARFSGGVSHSMVPTIWQLGYRGLITNDFVAGTGFGGESKVLLPCGGEGGRAREIEALTTEPIDASSDASFLAFAPKLGEAIDSGEIATGLLVHWPGSQCDSFLDVKCAAGWGMALGKFWHIDEYFVTGERPYHQGQLTDGGGQAAALLDQAVANGEANAISRLADRFLQTVQDEIDQTLDGLSAMISGPDRSKANDESRWGDDPKAVGKLVRAIGATPSEQGKGVVVLNPHAMPMRVPVSMETPPRAGDFLFAVSADADTVNATIDVSGHGFVIASPDVSRRPKSVGRTLGQRFRDRFLGKPTTIADRHFLHNEFMEVTIDEATGGISAVYSGKSRGNRFSMRLIAAGLRSAGAVDKEFQNGVMVCDKLATVASSAAMGVQRCTGRLLSSTARDAQGHPLAHFTITYTLKRGSRLIEAEIDLKPSEDLFGSGDTSFAAPWKNYLAARCAVSDESAIVRSISRDRLIRSGKRKIVAPLGVEIDEAERKTLIATHGLPFHKVEGERFVDTLIHVRGETRRRFRMDFGFDVTTPVTMAAAAIREPIVVPADTPDSIAPNGWFLHVSPQSVVVRDLQHHRLSDGLSVITLRLVQTRSIPEIAKVQCCREPSVGYHIQDDLPRFLNRLQSNDPELSQLQLELKKGVAQIALARHGAAHLALVLESQTKPHSSLEST